MTAANDAELLEVCAQLTMLDGEYISFDRLGRGSREDVGRVGALRDALVEVLAEMAPVTPEGARAQAKATLALVRHLGESDWDALHHLITRVVATAAGVLDLGELGTDCDRRFDLAVAVLSQ